MNSLMKKCWNFLIEQLISDDVSDIAKADIVKRLFSIKRPVRAVNLIITTKDKEISQVFDIKYRRDEYPELKIWRKKVFERDNYTCTQCGKGGKLQAHHIKRWADYPELRFDVSNGQTLCVGCHSKTEGFMRRYNGV